MIGTCQWCAQDNVELKQDVYGQYLCEDCLQDRNAYKLLLPKE